MIFHVKVKKSTWRRKNVRHSPKFDNKPISLGRMPVSSLSQRDRKTSEWLLRTKRQRKLELNVFQCCVTEFGTLASVRHSPKFAIKPISLGMEPVSPLLLSPKDSGKTKDNQIWKLPSMERQTFHNRNEPNWPNFLNNLNSLGRVPESVLLKRDRNTAKSKE